jgi:transposase-like protein
MPKRFQLNRPDQAKAVAVALATCTDVNDQQRLLAMRLAASGQLTADQIAQQVGIRRRQFFNWVSALKQGGVTALLARAHGGGSPPQVKGKVLAEFQAGLQAGQWKRAKEIQQWLRRQHQIQLGL